MRKSLLLLIILLLSIGMPASVASAASARAADFHSEQPVVHAVLLWSNGCPYCTQVLTKTLPPIQDKYRSQLSILLIEVVTLKDIENLYSLGSALGLTKEQVAVPFLILNHTALVGADQIGSKLSGLVDQYLTSGGLQVPDLPPLGEMLPKGTLFSGFDPGIKLIQQPAAGNNATGMALAWAIMVLMVVALVLAVAMILRAFNGKPLGEINRWLDYAIPILSIIGLGASIYLTYVEVTHTQALCGPVGDCNAVQSSPYAKLFGLIPIGLVGAIGYIAILFTWGWRRYRTDSLARVAGPAMFGMALFGTLFSIYLTYLELFVIHAVCIWCLSSAVVITALMLLNLPPLTQWLATTDEDE